MCIYIYIYIYGSYIYIYIYIYIYTYMYVRVTSECEYIWDVWDMNEWHLSIRGQVTWGTARDVCVSAPTGSGKTLACPSVRSLSLSICMCVYIYTHTHTHTHTHIYIYMYIYIYVYIYTHIYTGADCLMRAEFARQRTRGAQSESFAVFEPGFFQAWRAR